MALQFKVPSNTFSQMEISDSKEVGLAVGQILGSQLFGFDDLHYGYWSEDLPVNIRNFGRAQELYSQMILETIPSGVKTILDVGAGSGKQAERLINHGYHVDCVSPSDYLAERITKRLGNQTTTFHCKIEDFSTDKKYDLVLFSESFQYVDITKTLPKVCEALTPNGYLLICDFFKKNQGTEGPLGGGHFYGEFTDKVARFPLREIKNDDVTDKTAPTMGMFGQILDTTAKPVKDLVGKFIRSRHPTLYQFLMWKFKDRFERLNLKYFRGQLSTETFKEYKTYRLLLFQKLTDC